MTKYLTVFSGPKQPKYPVDIKKSMPYILYIPPKRCPLIEKTIKKQHFSGVLATKNY
jgi:hypothetical protein